MTFVLSDDRYMLSARERFWSIVLLLAVALFTIFDIVEDTIDGAPLTHTLTEGFIVVGTLFGAIYIWRKIIRGLYKRQVSLQSELDQTKEDLEHWRAISSQYMKGFSTAVDTQLKHWGVSEAEADVAFLMLKGLSFKEIADLRSTSERTVRQQAAAIYKKSGLESRAQLAAFFLEDAFER